MSFVSVVMPQVVESERKWKKGIELVLGIKKRDREIK